MREAAITSLTHTHKYIFVYASIYMCVCLFFAARILFTLLKQIRKFAFQSQQQLTYHHLSNVYADTLPHMYGMFHNGVLPCAAERTL